MSFNGSFRVCRWFIRSSVWVSYTFLRDKESGCSRPLYAIPLHCHFVSQLEHWVSPVHPWVDRSWEVLASVEVFDLSRALFPFTILSFRRGSKPLKYCTKIGLMSWNCSLTSGSHWKVVWRMVLVKSNESVSLCQFYQQSMKPWHERSLVYGWGSCVM